MKRRLVGGVPVSLLDVTLRCRTMKCEKRIVGSIRHAVDSADADRRTLTQCYTLLVAEGFAGFPGDCSPSGGPSWTILNMVIANNRYKATPIQIT